MFWYCHTRVKLHSTLICYTFLSLPLYVSLCTAKCCCLCVSAVSQYIICTSTFLLSHGNTIYLVTVLSISRAPHMASNYLPLPKNVSSSSLGCTFWQWMKARKLKVISFTLCLRQSEKQPGLQRWSCVTWEANSCSTTDLWCHLKQRSFLERQW